MRLHRSVPAILAATTALTVLGGAPASAAADTSRPVIGKMRVAPGTVVLSTLPTTRVTVEVTVTDDVGVTGVLALLYPAALPAPDFSRGVFIDNFTRVGTSDVWRAEVNVPATRSPGKYAIVSAAFDAAMNLAESQPVTAAYLKRVTRLSLNATPEPVKAGAAVKVSGTLTRLDPTRGFVPFGSRTVKVYFKPVGGSWTYRGAATTDSAGKWSRSFTATVDGTWQAKFQGTWQYLPKWSAADAVDVL